MILNHDPRIKQLDLDATIDDHLHIAIDLSDLRVIAIAKEVADLCTEQSSTELKLEVERVLLGKRLAGVWKPVAARKEGGVGIFLALVTAKYVKNSMFEERSYNKYEDTYDGQFNIQFGEYTILSKAMVVEKLVEAIQSRDLREIFEFKDIQDDPVNLPGEKIKQTHALLIKQEYLDLWSQEKVLVGTYDDAT